MLGFSEEMMALYIAMDSSGTTSNIADDCTIALVVNKIHKR